jgi:hypothetical protein
MSYDVISRRSRFIKMKMLPGRRVNSPIHRGPGE